MLLSTALDAGQPSEIAESLLHSLEESLGAFEKHRELVLAIMERLAAADPGNAGWQRDLAASHEKIGDVLRAQGNLPAALDRHKAVLAIMERLAAADPGNAGWQHDLSVSHSKIGKVLQAQGNLPAALDSYKADLAIMGRLAAADPGNAGWQRDLSVSHERIGNLTVQITKRPGADYGSTKQGRGGQDHRQGF
jgi:tetratricopeptide (TPR) repeat protein